VEGLDGLGQRDRDDAEFAAAFASEPYCGSFHA
jgi:hypothetical protein